MALVAAACGDSSDPYPDFRRSIYWGLGCSGIHSQRAARLSFVDGAGTKPVHFLQSRSLCYRALGLQSSATARLSAVQIHSRRARCAGGFFPRETLFLTYWLGLPA